MGREDRSKGFKALWRNHDYMVLWTGQSLSSLGTGISQVAFPILIFVLTNNPAMAGFIFSVGQLPYLLFSLPVGALVDRWDRKWVMILCTAGLASCSLRCSHSSILSYVMHHYRESDQTSCLQCTARELKQVRHT